MPSGVCNYAEVVVLAGICNASLSNSILPRPKVDLPCDEPCDEDHYLKVQQLQVEILYMAALLHSGEMSGTYLPNCILMFTDPR